MKPSRMLYMLSGAMVMGIGTLNNPDHGACIAIFAVSSIAAIVFDYNDL